MFDRTTTMSPLCSRIHKLRRYLPLQKVANDDDDEGEVDVCGTETASLAL